MGNIEGLQPINPKTESKKGTKKAGKGTKKEPSAKKEETPSSSSGKIVLGDKANGEKTKIVEQLSTELKKNTGLAKTDELAKGLASKGVKDFTGASFGQVSGEVKISGTAGTVVPFADETELSRRTVFSGIVSYSAENGKGQCMHGVILGINAKDVSADIYPKGGDLSGLNNFATLDLHFRFGGVLGDDPKSARLKFTGNSSEPGMQVLPGEKVEVVVMLDTDNGAWTGVAVKPNGMTYCMKGTMGTNTLITMAGYVPYGGQSGYSSVVVKADITTPTSTSVDTTTIGSDSTNLSRDSTGR